MRFALSALITYPVSCFRSDDSLRLENIALRHQLSFIRDGNDGSIILRGGQRVRKSSASLLAAVRRISALSLNNPLAVIVRRNRIKAGWHPP